MSPPSPRGSNAPPNLGLEATGRRDQCLPPSPGRGRAGVYPQIGVSRMSLASVVLLLSAAPAASAAAASVAGCSGGRTLVRNDSVRVFERGDQVFSCWRKKPQRLVIRELYYDSYSVPTVAGGWLAYGAEHRLRRGLVGLFATGLDVGPVSGSPAGLVGLPVISAMAVGATVGRWWAPGLPLLVVPVLALPWGYTAGAPPDYGIGFFVAAGFLLLSIPATLVGFGGTIAVRRRRR